MRRVLPGRANRGVWPWPSTLDGGARSQASAVVSSTRCSWPGCDLYRVVGQLGIAPTRAMLRLVIAGRVVIAVMCCGTGRLGRVLGLPTTCRNGLDVSFVPEDQLDEYERCDR